MRLYNIYGNLVKKSVSQYIVDWDGKSRSNIQFETKQFLKQFWKNHIVYEEFPVYGSLMKVDIVNATMRIAVEVNGAQHNQFHYFHNKSPAKYLKSIKNDIQKREWLEKNNFKVVEINHDEVALLSHSFFKEKFGITL